MSKKNVMDQFHYDVTDEELAIGAKEYANSITAI